MVTEAVFSFDWKEQTAVMRAAVNESGELVGLWFVDHDLPGIEPKGPFVPIHRQLAEYFQGARDSFSLPVAAEGTPFQNAVWAYLETIPFGATKAYGEIAAALGDIKKTRAVGRANGQNPVSIVVPCHRVIGKDGALTGYAGGLENKRRLLRHEGALLV